MDERKWQKPDVLPLSFFFLSLLIGIMAGLGAVAFRGLIAFFHNLLFLGKFSFIYDANIHTPSSRWRPFVTLVPVFGADCDDGSSCFFRSLLIPVSATKPLLARNCYKGW